MLLNVSLSVLLVNTYLNLFHLSWQSFQLLLKSLFPLWASNMAIKSWRQAPQLLSNAIKQEEPLLSLFGVGRLRKC